MLFVSLKDFRLKSLFLSVSLRHFLKTARQYNREMSLRVFRLIILQIALIKYMYSITFNQHFWLIIRFFFIQCVVYIPKFVCS